MANIYRLNYETKDMFYKIHIAAINMQEAINYLKKMVKKQFKITETTELCQLDAITLKAKPTIYYEGSELKQIPENKVNWKCPWCGNDYTTEQGLKIHIGKSHK